MHEWTRMAYLDALGIDSYVSRKQLPGAAPTRRLVVVAGPLTKKPDVHVVAAATSPGEGARSMPQVHRTVPPQPPTSPEVVGRQDETVPQFSLSAIVAGEWLWLEELAGMPLTTDQVQLVQSMAQALGLSKSHREGAVMSVAPPDVAHFIWPIHTNHQLDLGEEAARAAVAGFVGRRLEQHGCRGLVLLGQSCAQWVPLSALGVLSVSTSSSAEMLASPALKAGAWRDLLPLLGTS